LTDYKRISFVRVKHFSLKLLGSSYILFRLFFSLSPHLLSLSQAAIVAVMSNMVGDQPRWW